MNKSCSTCFFQYRDEDLMPCRECWHTETLEAWKTGEKKCNAVRHANPYRLGTFSTT